MSALQSVITLYDVEFTLEGKTLSPFVVRLRLLLDYKNISYETVWIDFPEIEAAAKAVGAPPTRTNADGSPGYTIPFVTIVFGDKPMLTLSDSVKIAEYIEDMFPDPENRLLPKETRVLQGIFTKYLFEKVIYPVMTLVFMSYIRHMRPHTQDWFIESRTSIFGMPLMDIVPQDEVGIAKAWLDFDAGFDELSAHLDKAGEGNCRISGDVSYAEFELISVLNLVKRLSFDEGWKRLESRNGGRWTRLMDLPVYKMLLKASRGCE